MRMFNCFSFFGRLTDLAAVRVGANFGAQVGLDHIIDLVAFEAIEPIDNRCWLVGETAEKTVDVGEHQLTELWGKEWDTSRTTMVVAPKIRRRRGCSCRTYSNKYKREWMNEQAKTKAKLKKTSATSGVMF